ncbi:unnamed protein product [Hymenolepis diminuta]|uniref:Nonsense-mediated mRNA decay factor SMG8 n=1 Tax=Hymenolepis diminuta TaxID=6216 RepID=A0A0R3SVA6_HYMDI|nr:unnamed protein product [Hymenolepis diminuta]
MINHLRLELYSSVETILKLIAISPYCVSMARVACPRLLFVFKLPPTIAARNLAKNQKALANLERNLSLQIYNVFQESGLLDKLFTIDGFHTVRVLLPDCIEPIKVGTECYADDDLAQQMLERILSCTGISSLTSDFDTKSKRQPLQLKNEYSAPGAPRNRSFAAFLESNVSNLLEDIEYNDAKDPYLKNLPELPSVKCWFIICFKLYTSLFGVGNSSEQSHSEMPYLYDEWNKLLSSTYPNSIANFKFFASQFDFDRKLSRIRCEKAYAAAEAHYLKDLPAHYSRIYHQARVISSYNAFFNLARGPCVVSSLKDLTHRLARLYLAGRVNCPVLLVSGSTCRRELHATPQRFPGITSALLRLRSKLKTSESVTLKGGESEGEKATDCYLLMKHIKSALTSAKISSILHDDFLRDCLQDVPSGRDLQAPWQYAWIGSVAKMIEQEKDKIDPALSGIVKDTSSLKHLSIMSHRSNKRFVSACNCGRTLAVRNDPYDYKEANWDFYCNLEARCCNKCENIPLAPMFLMEKGHDLHTPFEFLNMYSAKQESKGIQEMSCSTRLSQSPGYFNRDLLNVVDEPAFVPTTFEPNSLLGAKIIEDSSESVAKSSKIRPQETAVEEVTKSSKEIIPEHGDSNENENHEGIFKEASKPTEGLDDHKVGEVENLSESCTSSTEVALGRKITQADEYETDRKLEEELEKVIIASSKKKNVPTFEPSESILDPTEKSENSAEQLEEKWVEMESRNKEENLEMEKEPLKKDKLVEKYAYEKITARISGSISSDGKEQELEANEKEQDVQKYNENTELSKGTEEVTAEKECEVKLESVFEKMVITTQEKKNKSSLKQSERPGKSTYQMKLEQKETLRKKSPESVAIPETVSSENEGTSKKEEHSKQLAAGSTDRKAEPINSDSIDPFMNEKVNRKKVPNVEGTEKSVEEYMMEVEKSEISLKSDAKKISLENVDLGEKLEEVSVPIQKESVEEKSDKSVKRVEIKQGKLGVSEGAPMEVEEKEAFYKEQLVTEKSSELQEISSYVSEYAEKSKKLSKKTPSIGKLEMKSQHELHASRREKSNLTLTSTEISHVQEESRSTNPTETLEGSKSTDDMIAPMITNAPFSGGKSLETSNSDGKNTDKEQESRNKERNVEQSSIKPRLEQNAPKLVDPIQHDVSPKKEAEETSKESQVLMRKLELFENAPKYIEGCSEKLSKPSEERKGQVKMENNPVVDDLPIQFDSLTFVDVFSKLEKVKSDERGSRESPPFLDSSLLKNKTMVDFCDGMSVLGQMLHIIPLYTSWSIHRLGKYSSYSHSRGIAAPGFLRDGNYLLPNDVPLHFFHESPSTLTRPKGRSNRGRDFDSVKLFIGYEMECPLGHRFFLAGINRPMIRNMTSTEVKRAVRELLESNIPIFTPCRCSRTQREASKEPTTWAQLMRVYVAIPNVLIRARFAPVVQVAEGCPSFHLGPTLDKLKDLKENPDATEIFRSQPGYVNLEEGYIWVLRLPFAYQHDGVVYHRPQDLSQMKNFCLLKSSIQILHV